MRKPVELILLLAAFTLLGALTLFSMTLSQWTSRDRANAARVEAVEQNLIKVQINLRAAESGQRGYLLTGNREFLQTYNANIGDVAPAFSVIDSAFENTPYHQIYLDLKQSVAEKMEELAATIKQTEAGNREQAIAAVKEGTGRRLMEDIRDTIAKLRGEMRRQIDETAASTQQLDRALFYLNAVGAALVVILASLSTFLLWRSNRSMQLAQAQLRENNENLETLIAERVDDLREANEEIQRFAYIVSHDLRSPLVNIMGFTSELEALAKELLTLKAGTADNGTAASTPEEARLQEEFNEAVAFIKSSIAKMERLIGAILKISREGSRPFRPEIIDMTALVQTIGSAMAHQVQSANARLIIDPLPKIETDRLAAEQVFTNLLDNAVKFLDERREGEIRVSARQKGRKIEFHISDNGRGIEDRDKSRIFELFRRAGQQNKPGEGMGLAYVLTLTRRLGGSVRVESEFGKGSTFIVRLPAVWHDHNVRAAA